MNTAPVKTSKRYRVISLFSGGMGLDIGLEQTGRFEILACVEKEEAFAKTIQKNKDAGRIAGNPILFNRDISDLAPDELLKAIDLRPGELDVLVGGPQCCNPSSS